MAHMTDAERAALVERLNRTPLYDGGDETSLGEDAAAEIACLSEEVERLREERLAAFDFCIKEAADLRNTQSAGQLSWWACNELLGRFHSARGKIARAALSPKPKGE